MIFKYYKDKRYGVNVLKPLEGEAADIWWELTKRREVTEKDIEHLCKAGVQCEQVVNPDYAL